MRHEFSKATKKAALLRSAGLCEGVGNVYGLPSGVRCNSPLAKAWEADHYPLPAHADASNTLENCVAVCPECHRFKTRTFDIPAEAKIKRVVRKHGPIESRRKPKAIIKSRSFSQTLRKKMNGKVEVR